MQVEGQHHQSLLWWMATGARVSNTYPTCRQHWDSLSKERLIPDGIIIPHGIIIKEFRLSMGMRSIRQLAGWRPTKPTMDRGSERKVPHIGTETRSKLLREAAVRNIGQWARAWTSQVAWRMTALWVVNFFYKGIKSGMHTRLHVLYE